MSLELKTPEDASVTSLVSGIIKDLQDLLKQQVALLKHEVRADLRRTKDAGILIAAGGGVALAGGLLLAFMLAELLQWAVPALPVWACYGLCGLPLAAAGAGLVYAGMLKFESFTDRPSESVQALKENMQWITNPK